MKYSKLGRYWLNLELVTVISEPHLRNGDITVRFATDCFQIHFPSIEDAIEEYKKFVKNNFWEPTAKEMMEAYGTGVSEK
jgi:hypothetical protein